MNMKQERFCLEYAKSGNVGDSYLSAGYKAKNRQDASRHGCRLLSRDDVKARLQELTEEIRSQKIASIAEIQERLSAIVRGELEEEVVVLESIEKGVTEARIVKKKPSNNDAIKAAHTLARIQGGLDGSVNVSVVVPVIGGEDSLEE